MNKHEQISDARRIVLRKFLGDVSMWCNKKITNSQIDTEKTLNELSVMLIKTEEELAKIN